MTRKAILIATIWPLRSWSHRFRIDERAGRPPFGVETFLPMVALAARIHPVKTRD